MCKIGGSKAIILENVIFLSKMTPLSSSDHEEKLQLGRTQSVTWHMNIPPGTGICYQRVIQKCTQVVHDPLGD